MHPRNQFLALALLAMGASAIAQADAPATAPKITKTHALATFAELQGISVVNDAQISLGEISDLLVEGLSGEIRYAVIEVGGFLGMGEEPRVVPWHRIRVVADEEKAGTYHATSRITETQVKAAPVLAIGAISAAELDPRVESVFGKEAPWSTAEPGAQRLVRLSQLDDLVVVDSAGRTVGPMKQLILATDENYMAYAVLETAKEPVSQVAILWQSLNVATVGTGAPVVTTRADLNRVAQAPKFDGSDWPRMSSTDYITEVGTYYGTDPYWKNSRFTRVNRLPARSLANERLLVAGGDISLTVRNESRVNLGKISDLLINPESGEIRYAVLDMGAFLGMGGTGRVIPWNRVQVVTGEGDSSDYYALTTLTEAQAGSAPTLEEGSVIAASLDERVALALGETSVAHDSTRGVTYLARLSNMGDLALMGPAGAQVGMVKSLVLAPNQGWVAYAVVAVPQAQPGKASTAAEQDAAKAEDSLVSLPWSSLRYSISENKLTASTTVGADQLAKGPKYDAADWENMSSDAWMSDLAAYYGTEPLWAPEPSTAMKHGRHAESHFMAMTNELIGLGVQDDEQTNLGEIREILFDPKSGEISYAVIGTGGLLGIAETLRIIPWRFIQITPVSPQVCSARTSLTKAQVASAPQTAGTDIIPARIDRSVETVFGLNATAASTDDTRPGYARLTQMAGTSIQDPTGKTIGEIKNVALAPQNNCLAFVIVDTTEEAGNRRVALPMACLKFSQVAGENLRATTMVNSARFQTAPAIDESDWTHMSSKLCTDEMAAFYGCPQFWKNNRFLQARQAPANRLEPRAAEPTSTASPAVISPPSGGMAAGRSVSGLTQRTGAVARSARLADFCGFSRPTLREA